MTDNEQKRIFSKNLTDLLAERNKTQREVAEAISVSPQTFNTWCQGIALPRMEKVQRLATYFGVLKSDLIDEKNNASYKKIRGVKIPVYGRVAAGFPIEMTEEIIDTEEITEELARTGEFFGLQIHGDSMEPKISEGDVVIVRKQPSAETGQIVIATVDGTDATCKKFKKHDNGISLISSNPKYDPMFFTSEEVISKPVCIIGRVVELRAKF